MPGGSSDVPPARCLRNRLTEKKCFCETDRQPVVCHGLIVRGNVRNEVPRVRCADRRPNRSNRGIFVMKSTPSSAVFSHSRHRKTISWQRDRPKAAGGSCRRPLQVSSCSKTLCWHHLSPATSTTPTVQVVGGSLKAKLPQGGRSTLESGSKAVTTAT